MSYEPVIGLEIHAELKTKTKMFCQSRNDPDEKHPNVNICPVCMGHPGTLPVINQEAVKKVIMVGLALGGDIPSFSQFDRKNYFYPDLPKGYQISQYKHPLVQGGCLTFTCGGEERTIRIQRVHLEEDTGRLIHDRATESSLVDFNRAGVPLMELVTEPDFRLSEEIRLFGEELQRIFRYVGASDADMEKGQMRVEVNISLRPTGTEKFGTKVEVKNINSFKFAADAAEYEMKRQQALLEEGRIIAQETRGWDEHAQKSFAQRKKEEAHDYRYFPEPDLPPLSFSRQFVDELKEMLPELPAQKRQRFQKEFHLESAVTDLLVRDKQLADYFEQVVTELSQHDKETSQKPRLTLAPRSLGEVVLAQSAAFFLTQDFLRLLREKAAPVSEIRIHPGSTAQLILYLLEEKISNLAAKEVLQEMFQSGDGPTSIIEKRGLWQLSDVSDLEDIARHTVIEHVKAVEDYKAGRSASLQFLVGQIMRESRGKANPKIVQEILRKLIG